ncbi:MAG TPA: alpha/beta hydrolase [Steroidobacteraceae bacterium]|nr:alpha/beta hydrolase [Steroidobacteraceae bacterium]
MPLAAINKVPLHFEQTGRGQIPLVLVHGSWVSGTSWANLVPRLAETFHVVTYDRRGHSRSPMVRGPGSVHDDVADLAALIEFLEIGPACIVGNSFGASIALRLAATRPDLVSGIVAHEPSAFALLAEDPSSARLLGVAARAIAAVVDRIRRGDAQGAARLFTETVALGAGAWQQLSDTERRILIENAPTFLDEAADPEALDLDVDALSQIACSCLLTRGDQSPPFFAPVVRLLAETVPTASTHVFAGSGHVPHVTAPEAFADIVTTFFTQTAIPAGVGRSSQELMTGARQHGI